MTRGNPLSPLEAQNRTMLAPQRGRRPKGIAGAAGAVVLAVIALLSILAPQGVLAEPRIREIRIEPAAFELGPGESRNLTAIAVFDDDS